MYIFMMMAITFYAMCFQGSVCTYKQKKGDFFCHSGFFFAAFVFFLYGKIFDAYFQSAVQHTRHFNPETNGSCVTKSLGGMEIAAINVSLIHLAV